MSHDAIDTSAHPLQRTAAEPRRADAPSAPEALAMQVARLESELSAARRDIARLSRMQPQPASSGPTPEQLRLQSQAWDRLLGTSGRGHTASAGAAAPRTLTFEDIGARFFARNIGKVWLGLALLTAVVVAVREQWL
jgi:hypothetical protein